MQTFQLVMKKGPGPGQSYLLEKDEIVIGRDIHSDIAIIDQQLSRRHARFARQGDAYLVEDLASTNGTYVNGEKLTAPHTLQHGELVQLGGNVELAYEVFAGAAEATAQFSKEILSTSVKLAPAGQSQVFISYSRKDKEFVQKLHASIVNGGVKAWVDWEGIPLSADWWAEIEAAIEGAHAFLYVISPDSIKSEVCGRELETAIRHNKRLIPILYREPAQDDQMHDKVSSHNWVYMRDDAELGRHMPAMLDTINTDLDWVRAHTRLLERAVEWERASRERSFLLRGVDLDNAEKMIGQVNKTPALTSIQIEYIQDGQKLREELRQRELETAQTLKQQAEARERAEQERIATFWRSVARITLLIGFFACGYTFNLIAGIDQKVTSGLLGTDRETLAFELYGTIIVATVFPGLIGAIGAWLGYQLYQWQGGMKTAIDAVQFLPAAEVPSHAAELRASIRHPFLTSLILLGTFFACSVMSSIFFSFDLFASESYNLGTDFIIILFLSAFFGAGGAGLALWLARRRERRELRAVRKTAKAKTEETSMGAAQVVKLTRQLNGSTTVLSMLGASMTLTYFGISLYSHTLDSTNLYYLIIFILGGGALGLLVGRGVVWGLDKATRRPASPPPVAALIARYKSRAYSAHGFVLAIILYSALLPYPITFLGFAKYAGILLAGFVVGLAPPLGISLLRRAIRRGGAQGPADRARAAAGRAVWAAVVSFIVFAAYLVLFEDWSPNPYALATWFALPGVIGAGAGWLVSKMVD
jgi:hypothetical protein